MHVITAEPLRRFRRAADPQLAKPCFDDLDALDAELSALVVDLEARARYGKLEGLAMPLLAHARDASQRFSRAAHSCDDGLRQRFEPAADRIRARLGELQRRFAAMRVPS